HGAEEGAKVGDIADLHVAHHAGDAITHARPQRLRNVDAARRGTFLALVLEAAARDRDRDFLRIRRRMRDDEVLAAGFADEPRVRAIPADVVADLPPHAVEDRRAAGEVNAREAGRVERDVRDLDGIAADEVDDARREPR